MPKGIFGNNKPSIKKQCPVCKNQFKSFVASFQKFCSKKCYDIHQKGKTPWNKNKKGVMPIPWNKGMFAEKSNTWKGGRWKHSEGYIMQYAPNHPFATKQGYVFEHRLVMEKKLKRFLRPEERIHHINHLRSDNRLKNLQLLKDESEHQKLYHGRRNLTGVSSISYSCAKKSKLLVNSSKPSCPFNIRFLYK